MKALAGIALFLLCLSAYAVGRGGSYFPLSEGGTMEIIVFFNQCIDAYKAQSPANQKKVDPGMFCACLTDAARLNLRSTGKLMPDEEKASVCREVTRTAK